MRAAARRAASSRGRSRGRIRRRRRTRDSRAASAAPPPCARRARRHDAGARRPSRTGASGAPRTALLACTLLVTEVPVTMMRATPAAAARARTASRSSSKLSCVRLAPMSIKSNISARDCDDARRAEQRGRLDFGHAFDKTCCRRCSLAVAAFAAHAAPSPELLDLAGASALRLLPRRAARDRGRACRRSTGSATRPTSSTTATSRRCAARSSAAPTEPAWQRLSACARARRAGRARQARSRPKRGCSSPPARWSRATTAGASEALAQARERDDDNPRIALVEAWALERRGRRRRGAARRASRRSSRPSSRRSTPGRRRSTTPIGVTPRR